MLDAIACALFSLGWASSSASVLLLSSLCGFFLLCRLPSLGILSLLRIVVPLATSSSFCLPLLISLAASSISLSLPLVFLLEIFGWSLVPSWPSVISLSFAPLWVLAREVLFLVSRVSAINVWGFWVVSLVFSFRAPLLPFLPSRSLLRCRGTLYAFCLAPFCRVFGGFVCLLCAVLLLSPVPVSHLSRSSCLCLSSSLLSLSVSLRSFSFSF